MRRQDSRALGAFVLVLSFAGCKPTPALVEVDESLPKDAIQFADVSVTQWSHDKVSFASQAERMSLEKLQKLNADNASFTVKTESGEPVEITGQQMQSDLPSGDMALVGDVVFRRGPVTLHADKLYYAARRKFAQTSPGVTVRGGDFTMTSTGYARWDEEKNEVRIEGPVRLQAR